MLTLGGFEDVETSAQRIEIDLPPPRAFVPRHVGATPMAAGFAAASDAARQNVVRVVAERLVAYETERGLRVPFGTHLTVGTRAGREG